MTFKALLLENQPAFSAHVAEVDKAALPEGEVLIRVSHSTLNFKDALAIGNTSPIVRAWPMVAGIDAAGVVESSSSPDFRPGDFFYAPEDQEAVMAKTIPAGSVGTVDDVVGAALYLLSDEAGYVNGETVAIDGGAHLRTSGAEDLLAWTDADWEAHRASRG